MNEFDRMIGKMASRRSMERYRRDIVLYAWEKHGIWLWGRLAEACDGIVAPPHRVMMTTANGVGKTLMLGVVIAWFYDCFDPGIGVCTAPKFDQIKKTTFKEARNLLKGRKELMPSNPEIYGSPRHHFSGFTASSATSFQGTHEESLMLIFEEATGIAAEFWTAARSIIAGGENCFWVAALNPTDATSAAKGEEEGGYWKIVRISSFEHPNILAELTGHPAPIPGAVRLGYSPTGDHTGLIGNMMAWGDRDVQWLDEREKPIDVDLYDPATYGFSRLVIAQDAPGAIPEVSDDGSTVPGPGTPPAASWTLRAIRKDRKTGEETTVTADEVIAGARATFPKRFWRPGPDGEPRICGRYPSQSAYAIFSEASMDRAFARKPAHVWTEPVTIGCDVARFGDDQTTIHSRVGVNSRTHEEHSKQGTDVTAEQLKQLCRMLAPLAKTEPWKIPCLIDDTSVGGGVTDQKKSSEPDEKGKLIDRFYNFIPVNFGQKARDSMYPNARSEMLFDLAKMLDDDEISLGWMGRTAYERFRSQASKYRYKLDNQGRRVAESKEDYKKRTGRSPDDVDGLALCYYKPSSDAWFSDNLPIATTPIPRPTPITREIGEPSESRARYRL